MDLLRLLFSLWSAVNQLFCASTALANRMEICVTHHADKQLHGVFICKRQSFASSLLIRKQSRAVKQKPHLGLMELSNSIYINSLRASKNKISCGRKNLCLDSPDLKINLLYESNNYPHTSTIASQFWSPYAQTSWLFPIVYFAPDCAELALYKWPLTSNKSSGSATV